MITLTNFAKEVDVRSHNRVRTSVKGTRSFLVKDYKRVLQNKLHKDSKDEVTTGLKFAAGLLGVTAVGIVGLKAKYKMGLKNTAKYVESRGDDIIKEFTEYLADPKKAREITTKGRKTLIQKSKDPFPFAQLSDPEAVQKSNFLNMLQQLKNKDSMHITVGGFDTMGITGLGISGAVGNPGKLKTNFSDHAFMGFINNKLQTATAFPRDTLTLKIPRTNRSMTVGGIVGKSSGVLEKYKDDLSAVLGNKYNYHPDGRELAAYVYAANKMYPGKNINLTGQCAGGLVTNYAHETLNLMKKQGKFNGEIRNMNISTPYFGMHDLPKNEMITVTSTKDMFDRFPSKNKTRINDVNGHSYFTNKNSKDTGYENSTELLEIQRKFYK